MRCYSEQMVPAHRIIPGVLAQVKRVGEEVFGDVPALGDAGFGLERFGIPTGEPFEEGVDHPVLGLAGDNGGVEAFDLGAVDEGEVGRR